MRLSVIPFIILGVLSAGLGIPEDEEWQNNKSLNPQSSGECICVKYYLCNDTKPMGLIDIAGTRDLECSHYLERCCQREKVLTENKPLPLKPRPQPVNSCGIRHEGIDIPVKIDDDDTAGYGEFPWMVAVIHNDTGGSQEGRQIYQCGGSLIHPQVVLTAAHCAKRKDNLLIHAGEWDSGSEYKFYPTQDRRVLEVVLNDQFNNHTLNNNIALIILEAPINMTLENVGLICLPEYNEVMEDRNCVTSGWGKQSYGKGILKHGYLPTISHNLCQDALRKTRLGTNFNLHESYICAGGQEAKDSCKGDSGAALACPHHTNDHVYVQAGITAWGVGCNGMTPQVYVNVPYFINWIKEKMKERNLS